MIVKFLRFRKTGNRAEERNKTNKFMNDGPDFRGSTYISMQGGGGPK